VLIRNVTWLSGPVLYSDFKNLLGSLLADKIMILLEYSLDCSLYYMYQYFCLKSKIAATSELYLT
jgi:hypothetical protein